MKYIGLTIDIDTWRPEARYEIMLHHWTQDGAGIRPIGRSFHICLGWSKLQVHISKHEFLFELRLWPLELIFEAH